MSNNQLKKLKAEVANRLAELNAQNNGLRPSEVVEEARPKESPLHCEFEWKDHVAAEQYRLNQARQLIRATLIPVQNTPETIVPVRFVHVPPTETERKKAETGEGVYRPVIEVIKSPDLFARALSALVSKVNAAQAAAEELRAAAEGNGDEMQLARIAVAITAMQTASAAVSALH